jgi:RHS repeat-associated protein
VTIGTDAQNRQTITDALGNVTAFGPIVDWPVPPRPHAPVLLGPIYTADNLALPNLQYVYDAEGRVREIDDAITLQVGDAAHGGRDPWQLYIADGGRGERDDPLGEAYTVYYDVYGHPARVLDELGRETDQASDGRGRVLATTFPEGDQELIAYDVRNNPLSLTRLPKPGSAEATAGKTLVETMAYGEGPTVAVCAVIITCDKPATSTNGNGYTTNYSWDSLSGLLTKIKLPADASGSRPETDFAYQTFAGVKLLTGKTQYISRSPATVTVATAYAYNASNDYVPQSVTVDPTGLNLSTGLIFDDRGLLTQVDGPRTDVADITSFVYDLNGRKTYEIQPDPDGAGPHPRPAIKSVYDGVGRVIESDRGTTTSSTAADFSTNDSTQATYDPAGEKLATITATSVTQMSYDAAGRVLCTAQRLNPVSFPSLPMDACSPAPSGAYGPDRITKLIYDPAGEILQEQRGIGSAVAETYATHAYAPDGEQTSVYDALGATHTTSYGYDGFNRLSVTTYPDATTEALTYDNDNNALTRKNRSGQTLVQTYDKLDRVLTKVVPSYAGVPTNTVSWAYDLANEITTLSDTAGNTLANTYDLAGRVLTAAQTMPGMAGARTVTSTYDDGAGDRVNRSKIAWPDGYNVQYAYDALSHLTAATDSDGTALASYTYDNLARHATTQYPAANDNVSYSWSAEDDLLTLAHNFAGLASDVSYTNSFNPAHEWASATISNAAYKYAVPGSGTDSYASVNVLNQYASMTRAGQSAQSLSYDTRGNMTSDGTFSYGYDPENRLVSATKTGMTAAYAFDPMGRRATKTVSGTATNFLHDGDTELAEYDGSGNLLRRYVPGLGIDDLIAMVTCTGTGCAGATATKTFFHTDKLGSVIAMSDITGHIVEGPFIYDAFGNCTSGGVPCSSGVPFRYTGQRFDSETGLYHYRARCYSSVLGRFCQTDPIGYRDSLNLYGYTGDNPLNATDPFGLCEASRIGAAPDSICGGTQDPDDKLISAGSPNNSTTHPRVLQFITVRGGPGQKDWYGRWKVTPPSVKGGHVVQKKSWRVRITRKDGSVDYHDALPSWEAWTVLAGHSWAEPTNNDGYDDDFGFRDVMSNGDKISTTITGVAVFHEGLTDLPSIFYIGNSKTKSGDLPSSRVDPQLSDDDATEPVIRDDTYDNPY